ncbi:MAG: hypothetical protein JXA92_00345 [candidate division Zixibacteria bacterium]|nr:hypothetical protein [candidate division Zixibacteria bacterium]
MRTNEAVKSARKGLSEYFKRVGENGQIDTVRMQPALAETLANLETWLREEKLDTLSPNLRKTIIRYIEKERWAELVNAFRRELRFGTAGIRGLMAFDRDSIIKLQKDGLDAAILKGPNTLNDIVLLKTTAGAAAYGLKKGFSKVVVGYDSRVRGVDFARRVAELLLAFDYTVYFFDAPCPYPELTFAVPHETIRADIGILISASHNDYRYNGYKLSGANGSQFDPREREEMYEQYISRVKMKDIPEPVSFDAAGSDRLCFLGGDRPIEGFDYAGRENFIINFHEKYLEQIKSFLVSKNPAAGEPGLSIAYCPYHGAGYRLFPRILREVGFTKVKSVNGHRSRLGLNQLNGLFPAFTSDPGREQQPDPGDPRAAEIALRALREDYPDGYDDTDILIGTDPDADRCALTVRIPENQKRIYDHRDYYLLPADDMWTLIIWYRIHRELEKYGHLPEAEKKFITLSHTTTDSLTFLARKYGVGVVKSWVGFASMAAAARDIWENKVGELKNLKGGRDNRYRDLCHPYVCECLGMDNGQRSINIGIMEQSNGFSILGGPPPDERSLGCGGHVRDKDGTLAGLLLAEIAAWAKARKMTLIELLDKYIYLDPDIGLFMTFYEPDPLDGEYPGIEGDRLKKKILKKALELASQADRGRLELASFKFTASDVYRTGKYDRLYPLEKDFQFPDEGIRLYLDESLRQHVTIRPSGTSNSLRFHVQLYARPTASNLIEIKREMRARGKRILDKLREQLEIPRS